MVLVLLRNLKFVALPIPQIIGRTQKMGSPCIRPRVAPFLQNFGWAFVQMDPVDIPAKYEVRIALPVPEIIVIAVLCWGCQHPI